MGWSPSLSLSCWHGLVLSLAGRPREGATELDRVIELAQTLPASQQLTPLCVAHANHAHRCRITGETAAALAHSREAVNCAERTGNQTSRTYAYFHLGLANVLNEAWHDALEVLQTALTIAKERRVLYSEGGAVAMMAAAHLGLGDRARALTLAEEAIAICRRGGARLWEFTAQLTRMRALRETRGLQAKPDIEATFAEAQAGLRCPARKATSPSST